MKFKPGQSGNPTGRPVRKGKAAPGSDGVISYGGYLQSGEGSSALTGREKWTTYANAINSAIVATGVRYFGNLLAGTEWHAEPNAAGGADAQRGVEIVTQGLLESQMIRPWSMVVRKASMYRLYGFSLHATAVKRRPDGLIVFGDIAHRPQHTIERWLRADDEAPFHAVEQRITSGKVYELPLDECLYCVDDTLTDSPEGVGLLRHVIELVRRLGLYEKLEGSGYFSDMGGLPIARAPLEEIATAVGSTDPATVRTAIDSATATLEGVVANRIKSPEQQMYLKLDSATYRGTNPDAISSIPKWGVEIVKSETNGLAEVNAVIGRLQLEIARVLGIEFALVGGGDSAGTYGMHEDKTSMFASNLQTTLAEIGSFATRQLARRLVALNGLDPDTATPRLIAEPISTEAIETVTRSLGNLAMAGLAPDDPARNVLRKRMRLPPEPDRAADVMAPRAPAPVVPAEVNPQEPDELEQETAP